MVSSEKLPPAPLPPNMDFEPHEFGLDAERPGDRWLIRESNGDRELMNLIMEREKLGELQRAESSTVGISHLHAVHHLLQKLEERMNAIREMKGLPPRP